MLDSTALRWILALTVAAGCVILFELVRRVLVRRVTRIAERTRNRVDDVLADVARKTRSWFLVAISIGIGASLLLLPPRVTTGLSIALFIVTGLQIGLWATALLEGIVERWLATEAHGAGVSRTTLGAVRLLGRLVIWSGLLLVVLDNAGVNVTTLVAGLGIGGVAMALATQNILGDLFASLSIVLDKPFEVGDFIVVDDYMGTVEHVGLKTTRIRSLSGEQLVFSNANLLASRIRNYRRMTERRVEFGFVTAYDTDPGALRQIPALIEEIVAAEAEARFERAHFKGFGETGLTFEVVYHVLDPDQMRYMDIQQRINLGLCEVLAEMGVEFAQRSRPMVISNEQISTRPRLVSRSRPEGSAGREPEGSPR